MSLIIGETKTFQEPKDDIRSRRVELVNLNSEEGTSLMENFVAAHPEIWNEDIGE